MAEDHVPAEAALAPAFDHISTDLLRIVVEQSCPERWKQALAPITVPSMGAPTARPTSIIRSPAVHSIPPVNPAPRGNDGAWIAGV